MCSWYIYLAHVLMARRLGTLKQHSECQQKDLSCCSMRPWRPWWSVSERRIREPVVYGRGHDGHRDHADASRGPAPSFRSRIPTCAGWRTRLASFMMLTPSDLTRPRNRPKALSRCVRPYERTSQPARGSRSRQTGAMVRRLGMPGACRRQGCLQRAPKADDDRFRLWVR